MIASSVAIGHWVVSILWGGLCFWDAGSCARQVGG